MMLIARRSKVYWRMQRNSPCLGAVTLLYPEKESCACAKLTEITEDSTSSTYLDVTREEKCRRRQDE